MSDGILCQGCGIEAPVKHLAFHQNVGMLIMRQSKYIRGDLCKRCAHAHFWKKTGTTLAIGWPGMISFVIAPIYIIMNIVQYLRVVGMEGVPADARRPILDQQAVTALTPLRDELLERLGRGDSMATVARELAPRASVTPGQIVLYVRWLAEMSRQQVPEKTYGFPVLPAAVPAAPAPPPSARA